MTSRLNHDLRRRINRIIAERDAAVSELALLRAELAKLRAEVEELRREKEAPNNASVA